MPRQEVMDILVAKDFRAVELSTIKLLGLKAEDFPHITLK